MICLVPHVLSADVTVASSRSVLRAAQPLCASAVWGGQRSHFSVPPQKRHSKSRLRCTAAGLKCVRGAMSFASLPLTGKPVWSDQRSPNFGRSRRRLRCAHGTRSLTATPCAYVRVRVWRAMEENLQVAAMHVKSEAADEIASALALGSQDSPAPCGDTACRGGGGVDQTAEQAVTTSTPVLLCEYFYLWRQVWLLVKIKIGSFIHWGFINNTELSSEWCECVFLVRSCECWALLYNIRRRKDLPEDSSRWVFHLKRSSLLQVLCSSIGASGTNLKCITACVCVWCKPLYGRVQLSCFI